METPNYYAIIPANVRYDKVLKANEKLLYGEITALAQASGKCFASNEYFAELYGTTKETVSRWISNLKKCGYVDVIITYKEDGKTIDKRIITLLTKKSIPSCEKNQYPIDKKIKENNTRINNTSIKEEKINKKDFDLDVIEGEVFKENDLPQFPINRKIFADWIEYRKEIKKPITRISAKQQFKMLCCYSAKEQEEIINTSIQNGYQGLFAPKQQNNFNQAKSKRQQTNEFIDQYFADMNKDTSFDYDVEVIDE